MIGLMRTLLVGYGLAALLGWTVAEPHGGWLAGLVTFWIGGAILTLMLSAMVAWVQMRTTAPITVRADGDPELRRWDEDLRLERLEAELYLERIQDQASRTGSDRNSA